MKLTIYLLLFICTSFTTLQAQTGKNILKGKVLNSVTKQNLPGALIELINVSGSIIHTETDRDGKFKIKDVVQGKYTLKVNYIGYAGYNKSIIVKPDEKTEINIELLQISVLLEDVNVFTKVNGEKESSARHSEKNADNIINVISAQAMQRSPDINAANVLQRMSGVTLQKNSGADESYAILRGLEPRYNNTLINGVKIASPNEKSRFVSLDVVPSDLLQKIEVSKSLLPEMEGDAIGGTVNLVMKDAPESKTFKALGSIGYSQILWDRKYQTFSKSGIQNNSLYERKGSAYTAQPGDFSRSNLDFKSITALPTGIIGFTYGQRFLKNKLGLLIAENFQNQYFGTNSQLNQAVPDIYKNQPVISDISNIDYSTQQLNNGLTIHTDYNINNHHKITLTNVFLYSYLAQSRTGVDTALIGGNGGRTVAGNGPISNDYTSITDHQLLENLKLEGKHIISKHFLFDWAGVFSLATKRTPDRANLNINKKIDSVHTTSDINGPYTFKSTPYFFDEIQRIWQHNEDKDYDLLANLTYKLKITRGGLLEIKTGGLYRHKTRYNLQDEYDLKPLVTNTNGTKPEFTDINSAQWIVYDPNGTQAYDINNYRLFENIIAGFGQAKISLTQLDITGGVRIENTDQGYTLNTFYPTGINGVAKKYTDVLPSLLLKYKLSDKSNLRSSYFKSISRPSYYELVPAAKNDNSSATTEIGNPFLKHTVADNYDIRYELYPKNEEQLFIGAFYKKLQNPIEYAYKDVQTYTPVNLGNATVVGGEIVYTRYFGNFGVTGNYTYIYSHIKSPKFYTDVIARTTDSAKFQGRPLQGQTNNTINLSLLYKNDKSHLYVQLSYEYLGKTLTKVYPIYGFDYYRTPQSFLALSVEKELRNKHLTAFGKFNNLLNTPTVNKINNLETVRDIYKGSFSLVSDIPINKITTK